MYRLDMGDILSFGSRECTHQQHREYTQADRLLTNKSQANKPRNHPIVPFLEPRILCRNTFQQGKIHKGLTSLQKPNQPFELLDNMYKLDSIDNIVCW